MSAPTIADLLALQPVTRNISVREGGAFAGRTIPGRVLSFGLLGNESDGHPARDFTRERLRPYVANRWCTALLAVGDGRLPVDSWVLCEDAPRFFLPNSLAWAKPARMVLLTAIVEVDEQEPDLKAFAQAFMRGVESVRDPTLALPAMRLITATEELKVAYVAAYDYIVGDGSSKNLVLNAELRFPINLVAPEGGVGESD